MGLGGLKHCPSIMTEGDQAKAERVAWRPVAWSGSTTQIRQGGCAVRKGNQTTREWCCDPSHQVAMPRAGGWAQLCRTAGEHGMGLLSSLHPRPPICSRPLSQRGNPGSRVRLRAWH